MSLPILLLAGCITPDQHYQQARQLMSQELTSSQRFELINHLQQAAEAGNVQACYELAYVLLEDSDDAVARQGYPLWLNKAAELGMAQAQFDLGVYELRQNYNAKAGLAWLEKAAQTGDPRWQLQLSRYYCCSDYVPEPDQEKSFYWALQAAQAGLQEAQCHVGYCYRVGLGVPHDDRQSFFWMEKAAQAGYAISQNNLAICYEYGLGVKEDFAKAIYWYEQAIKNDFIDACINLAVLYIYSAPKPFHDSAKGFTLLQQAVTRGHARAMSVMGECYQFGVGVKRDMKQALYWQTMAHEKGYHIASYYLGRMHLEGVGTPKNVNLAFQLFMAAAEEETWGGAACALGDIYFNGILPGSGQDYERALICYTQAARQNNQRAMYQLGLIYEKGLGVSKNPHTALGWYEKVLSLTPEELRPSYTEQSLSKYDPVASTVAACQQAVRRLSK